MNFKTTNTIFFPWEYYSKTIHQSLPTQQNRSILVETKTAIIDKDKAR